MNCDHWYNVCWDFMCNAMYMLVNGDSSQNISEPFVTPVLIMCVAFALMMHSMMILWPSIHSSSDKTTLEWLPSSKLRQLAIQSSHLDFQLPKQCWMTFTVGRSQDWGFPTPKTVLNDIHCRSQDWEMSPPLLSILSCNAFIYGCIECE